MQQCLLSIHVLIVCYPGLLKIEPNVYKFLWIESFPLFTPDEQGVRTWQATHHPFTAPYDEDIPLLATDPAKVRGQHYDLVLNGMEIGGGSIRIHSPVMQNFIFDKVLQVSIYVCITKKWTGLIE